MKNAFVKLLAFGIGLLTLTAPLSGCGTNEMVSSQGAASGQGANTAPDFTAKLNDGSSFTLSEAKGKVVLINFWATWCGPCCGEMPAFERLHEDYAEDLLVIAVNYAEPEDTVNKFVEENGYTFPFAYDTEGKISALYPSNGIPYTIVIDKNGNVSSTFLGAKSADEQYEIYKAAIEEAINE